MFLRLNWETTGLSSRNALLASATLDCLSDLFKLDEALEFSKGASLEDHRTSTDPAGDATFIGELDREAIVTLGKLSADVDSFTLKELKQIHRRSRVAMEASMTNNLHIHQQIVKLLGNHIVLDSQRNLMLQLERVRKEVMRNYNAALDKCNDSHSRLRNLEKQRLQAEEEYVAAMMELNRMEQQKSKVLTLIETQHVGDGRRKRTTSM